MASLLTTITMGAAANASLFDPLITLLNGGSTAYRAFIKTSDASNYALKLQNTGSGGKALWIRNSADTADLLRISDTESIISNGTRFDVRAYGAVGDGAVDDAPFIQLAIDAAEALGGGEIFFPPGYSWNLASRIFIQGHSIYLAGIGQTATGVSPASIIKINTTTSPVIVYGNSASISPSFVGIHDLTCVYNVNLTTKTTWEGTSTGACIALDRVGRFTMERVSIAHGNNIYGDGLLIGTVNNPNGVTETRLINNEMIFGAWGVDMQGGAYILLDNAGRGAWGATGLGAVAGSAAINISGAGSSQPDGWSINGLFLEDASFGVRIRNSGGSLANGRITNCLFDGIDTAGIWFGTQSAAGLNGCIVDNTVINCLGASSSSPTGNTGILIDQDNTATMHKIQIHGGRIAGAGAHGIAIAAPASTAYIRETLIQDVKIIGCGVAADNTYDGINVSGALIDFKIMNCDITSRDPAGGTTDIRYGINIAAGCSNFVVAFNACINAQTGCINKGTQGNSTTAIYLANAGDETAVPMMMLPIFHYGNAAAGLTDAVMPLATSNGTVADAPVGIPAPFNCRIVALGVAATANIAGATLTMKVSVGGVAGTLSKAITVADATNKGNATQTSGDVVSQGTLIGTMITTPGGFTTNDVAAFVTITQA